MLHSRVMITHAGLSTAAFRWNRSWSGSEPGLHQTTAHVNALWLTRQKGVVGFAIAAACPGRHAIDALYVSRRGYGIGGALLECVCSWLGCRQDIYLEVPASSCWLVTFYGKHGFQLTGVESSAPVNRILNTSMPLYEMRRSAAEAHYGI
jgi:hypothetical protein